MIDWGHFKRLLAVSIIITLPVEAREKEEQDYELYSNEPRSRFYLKPFYNGGWGVATNMNAKSSAKPVTKDSSGTILDGSIFGEYKPKYEPGLLGGGLAIGFMTDSGLGFELEGIQSQQFKLKNKSYFYYLQNDDSNDRDEPEASQTVENLMVENFKSNVKDVLEEIKALYASPGNNGLTDVKTLLGQEIEGTGTLTINPGETGVLSYAGAALSPINGELKLNKLQGKIVIDNKDNLDNAVTTEFDELDPPLVVATKDNIDNAKESVKALYTTTNANGLKDIATLLEGQLGDDANGKLTIEAGSAASGAAYVGNAVTPTGLNAELKLNNLQNKIVINDKTTLDTKVADKFTTLSNDISQTTNNAFDTLKDQVKNLYSEVGENGITDFERRIGNKISAVANNNKTGDLYIGYDTNSIDPFFYKDESAPDPRCDGVPCLHIHNLKPLLIIENIDDLNNAVNGASDDAKPDYTTQINNARELVKGLYAAANGANGLTDVKTLIPPSITGTNGNLAVVAGDTSKSPEFSITTTAIPASGTLTLNDIGTKLAIDSKDELDAAVDSVFSGLTEVSMSPKESVDMVETKVKALYATADNNKGVVTVETYLGTGINSTDGGILAISVGDNNTAEPEYVVDPNTITANGTLTLNDVKSHIVIQDKSLLDGAVDAIFATLPEPIAPEQEEPREDDISTRPVIQPDDTKEETSIIDSTIDNTAEDTDATSSTKDKNPEPESGNEDISTKPNKDVRETTSNPLANTKIPIKYINDGFAYTAAMLNMYYSMQTDSGVFSPYIGGGIGFAKVTVKGFDNKESESLPFTLQGKVGATFNFNKSVIPYVGYRILYMRETEFSTPMGSSRITVNGKKYADAELDKTSETALEENTYALGKYSKKIRASYLLHNIEIGLVIPLKV